MMPGMNVLIILLLAALTLFVVGSLLLGRTTHEVQNVRDEEYVELEGTWIRYRITGEGPPVLLVHGLLSSSRIWERLAGRLSSRFTVYSLDLNGFGESDKPLSGYGVRHGSRLLYTFCAHFEISHATVVGHDIGGSMAVKLAADHPDTVDRLVLVAAPADQEQIDLPTLLWLAMLPVVGAVFYSLGQYVRPVRELWMRAFVSEREDLLEEVLEDAGRSTPAAVRSSYDVTRRETGLGRLARQTRGFNKPLLVVCGEEDQIVDPQSSASWTRVAPRSEARLIEECGHLPMVERPDEFEAHLLEFLTGETGHLEGVTKRRTSGDYEPADPEEAPEEPAADPVEPHSRGEAPADLRALRPEAPPPEAPGEHPAEEPEPEAPRVHKRMGSRGQTEGRRRAAESTRAAGSIDPSQNLIPELPDDLFDWPERWQDAGHRKGSRPEPPEDIEGSDAEGPEDARP